MISEAVSRKVLSELLEEKKERIMLQKYLFLSWVKDI